MYFILRAWERIGMNLEKNADSIFKRNLNETLVWWDRFLIVFKQKLIV